MLYYGIPSANLASCPPISGPMLVEPTLPAIQHLIFEPTAILKGLGGRVTHTSWIATQL